MKKSLLALALLLPMAVSAANYLPITAIEKHPFMVPAGLALTAADVRAAMIRGAVTHDWVIRDVAPGRMEAVLVEPGAGGWTITLEFVYTATDYSILYKSSENLLDRKGNIHSSYSRWTRNLIKAIDAQAIAMQVERQTIPSA